MFKKVLVFICIFAIAGAVYLSTNGQENSAKVMDVLGAAIRSSKGQLIDVREPSEYLDGHATGAINVPLSDIMGGKDFGVDKNQPIYVYCRSGARATQAKIKLEKDGYKKVINIGAVSNWEKDGGKICKTVKPDC